MKEVYRAAKVGEYIKLLDDYYSFNKKGDILKVCEAVLGSGQGLVRVRVKDHPHYTGSRRTGTWSYTQGQYVVLENYEEDKDMSFTKKALRTGDIVITRNGRKYVVMLNGSDQDCLINLQYDSREILDNYTSDLKNKNSYKWDVMKVYRPKGYERPWEYDIDCATPIYIREEVKEMTVEEISKALGYEVKVIKS